ncbi:MAG: DNA primase DnaG [Methanothrix soehngenii]|jgi:DNA primase|uniref:DNA primase DnaG n=1 Tax=Methanothrix TaxID=2222 RepID=UPI0023F23651|nr:MULTISPECIES: DNA primase DnaG [Methanothrix]MDD3974057.1 DNA primase DnaG [Methanothrix soehngenii]MDD4487837.1 DNA primase DnaG [Methanothrix soehngenii]MDD5256195.1 DNA primase DnaG [Methanothrix soehngenii]MDD5734910.1 DNA primase DnaG [Methanothrix soehngenii]
MQNVDTTKYVIYADITAEGIVERPDVVGAIFGQTEGLLGSDLDLRDLQKTGRLGRIDVQITSSGGKSSGTISIPSSFDKVETAILAAALETIDRVGPCIARIAINRIEDVRASKRRYVIERAKRILVEMFDENILETEEITEEIKQSVRVEEIIHLGKDNLPAGPNVLDSDAILVVEGRADVLNLLKYGIKNAVAVGGTNVPPTIADLCAKKVVTAFTDGDRGGELIVKELLQVADIDYVARAPDGKSVEDMTQKEIVRALRQKIPVEQVLDQYKIKNQPRKRREITTKRKSLIRERPLCVRNAAERAEAIPPRRIVPREVVPKSAPVVEEIVVAAPQEPAPKPEPEREWFRQHMDELDGTLCARLMDKNHNVLREVAVRDLARELKDSNGDVNGVIFDGVVTQRVLDIAADKGLEYLIGAKMGNIVKSPSCVKVVTKEA